MNSGLGSSDCSLVVELQRGESRKPGGKPESLGSYSSITNCTSQSQHFTDQETDIEVLKPESLDFKVSFPISMGTGL